MRKYQILFLVAPVLARVVRHEVYQAKSIAGEMHTGLAHLPFWHSSTHSNTSNITDVMGNDAPKDTKRDGIDSRRIVVKTTTMPHQTSNGTRLTKRDAAGPFNFKPDLSRGYSCRKWTYEDYNGSNKERFSIRGRGWAWDILGSNGEILKYELDYCKGMFVDWQFTPMPNDPVFDWEALGAIQYMSPCVSKAMVWTGKRADVRCNGKLQWPKD